MARRRVEPSDTPGVAPRVIYRRAVRAVAVDGNRLLLLHLPHLDAYKFPGGGVETGESDLDALTRELKEETGRHLSDVHGVLHTDTTRRPDRDDPTAVFEHESVYYAATVTEPLLPPHLDAHELADGITPVWVEWAAAVIANKIAMGRPGCDEYIARDLRVLKQIGPNPAPTGRA